MWRNGLCIAFAVALEFLGIKSQVKKARKAPQLARCTLTIDERI